MKEDKRPPINEYELFAMAESELGEDCSIDEFRKFAEAIFKEKVEKLEACRLIVRGHRLTPLIESEFDYRLNFFPNFDGFVPVKNTQGSDSMIAQNIAWQKALQLAPPWEGEGDSDRANLDILLRALMPKEVRSNNVSRKDRFLRILHLREKKRIKNWLVGLGENAKIESLSDADRQASWEKHKVGERPKPLACQSAMWISTRRAIAEEFPKGPYEKCKGMIADLEKGGATFNQWVNYGAIFRHFEAEFKKPIWDTYRKDVDLESEEGHEWWGGGLIPKTNKDEAASEKASR